MEIRHHYTGDESISTGTLEAIKVKMLLDGQDDAPSAIRLEMSSENDLFFHFSHSISAQDFHLVQEQQKLVVDYSEYPNVLIRMLNACIREPHQHLAIFVIKDQEEARLDFIQNMEYKFVELVSCNCQRSSEEVIQKQITFRYNATKQSESAAAATAYMYIYWGWRSRRKCMRLLERLQILFLSFFLCTVQPSLTDLFTYLLTH
jgi:hypothetical protein